MYFTSLQYNFHRQVAKRFTNIWLNLLISIHVGLLYTVILGILWAGRYPTVTYDCILYTNN